MASTSYEVVWVRYLARENQDRKKEKTSTHARAYRERERDRETDRDTGELTDKRERGTLTLASWRAVC